MLTLIPVLICFPFVAAVILAVNRNDKVRRAVVYGSSILIMMLAVHVLISWMLNGCTEISLYLNTELVDGIMILGELFLMILVTVLCIRHKKYPVILLSWAQTLLVVWLELFGPVLPEQPHILLDRLSILMILIVAIVGGMICLYAVGYMDGYHRHHTEYKDRRSFFTAMLFLFLGAMFGLVLSSNLIWIDLFWEITSISSFLLIGYTRTPEAVHNSFRALWMNLLGGLGFAVAIAISILFFGTETLQDLIAIAASGEFVFALIPIAMLAFAGLTKSAQLPFSTWLLGAMVAPTPTSALLHSATMVKAGVYLLVRLAPAMNGNLVGTLVSLVGGFTFFIASMLAISQSDAKKVLAYSTISNLGLITACAGVGLPETIWAAVLLIIFHAVSKSMLFQAVGAIENSTGSRDIESMQSLILRLPKLTSVLIIGILGMFVAPFGMLISKWAALKAFVDANNTVLILFLAFGSATTMFYWTKWLCKLISRKDMPYVKDVTERNEYFSLFVHAALVILLCLAFPILSVVVVEPLLQEMYGYSVTVLSQGNMIIMIIMLISVFILPAFSYVFAAHMQSKRIINYMSGANTGDNIHFIDSVGESKELILSNWYMTDLFGEKKLLLPSQLFSTAVIVVLLCIIIGGAL